MPGFPLAAIGAGLGQFAQNYQQQQILRQNQQDQQLRRQLQMWQLRTMLEDRQRQNLASAAAAGLAIGGSDTGGSTGVTPVNPMPEMSGGGVGIPIDRAMPSPPLSP